ncbi:hypothetical protein OBA40_07350 [Alphaproteobacteria bacterium]|nr:hypothetical protein [Alphaproteobacteria bacterium]
MSNVPQTYNDDFDILSLIEAVWAGKWKIASVVAISLLLVFGFNIGITNTTFTATTHIKPITSVEFDKYSLFNESLKIIKKEKEKDTIVENEFNIFMITRGSLLSLYIEAIEEGSLLETAVDKFNLINRDAFDSESDYKEAIEKFASEIEIISPEKEKRGIDLPKKENRGIDLPIILKARYDDKDKWKDLLTFVNDEANRKVKASIINRFGTIVAIQNQKKDFAIKDIEIKIDNVKKDYDRISKARLAFLIEQAAIARKLNIQKNTISSQSFSTQNTYETNVKSDAPFYFRGYIAIEEEINQIKNRKDKTSFIKNLYELEQEKRTLKQDKTIERAIDLFNTTPLNQNNFRATLVKVATTDFKKNNKDYLYYALALVFGGFIGVVYVLIANAFANRRNYMVSS